MEIAASVPGGLSVVRWAGPTLLLLAVAGCAGGEAPLVGTSLDGESVDLLAGGPEAVVLFFVTPDCPISNRYVPEMNRLATELSEEGVATFLVYPDPAFSIEQIRQHRVEFSLEPPTLLDHDHDLVARARVEVTPEAALFRSSGELAYRGRIDNRFVDFGTTRPRATKRDLWSAVRDVLDGREVSQPTARAVGCYIPEPRHPSRRPENRS